MSSSTILNRKKLGKIFTHLTERTVRRETISRWAFRVTEQHYNGKVLFDPKEDELLLQKALDWLSGYDLQVEPGKYLHGEEDLAEFRKNSGL